MLTRDLAFTERPIWHCRTEQDISFTIIYTPLLLTLHLQTALLLFFTGKISKLRLSFTSNPATSSPHSPSPPATPPDFSVLTPVSESKIHKILSNCPNKQFDSDPILTQILYQAYQRMFIRTHPINHQHCQPLISGQFHPTLKEICHHATP